MKKSILILGVIGLMSITACQDDTVKITSLDKVTNITYSDGIITFNEVANAEGYNISFTHLEEVIYEDQIEDTIIDVSSIGLEGTITFEVSAYYQDIESEVATYSFDVLTEFGDVTFEAENYLYNFGTGKEQSNFRNNPQASNGAYVGGIDDAGQGVYINYLSPKAGTFKFDCYYTTDQEPAQNEVWINGEYQTTFHFTEKTGWGGATYEPAKAEVEITLVEGWNTISIFKNGDASNNYGSFTELDYFVLHGDKSTYNVDNLIKYGDHPTTYILEAEMGSPRKDGTVKNPAIVNDAYSNKFCLGGIEKCFDGVEWHFNSETKAKYTIDVAYSSGQFDGSKLPAPSIIVTQEAISPARSMQLIVDGYEIQTFEGLEYTSDWGVFTLTDQQLEITLEEGDNYIYCVLLTGLEENGVTVDSGFFQLDYANLTYIEDIE